MRKRLKPYLSAFRLRALLETQYRAAALGGMATQLFFGIVLCCVYSALFTQGQADVTLAETVSYVWLQQMLFRALMASEGELMEQILDGSIAYTLLRPVHQHTWWMFRTLAQKLVGVAMRLLPMLLCMPLLPPEMRLSLPESPLAAAQFLLSLGCGFLCVTQINLITMAVSMRTLDNRGISGLINLVMMFLCGNIIPLTLFPPRLQLLMRFQPFAQALDAPIRMYLHAQPPAAFALSLAVQLGWTAALWALSRQMWNTNLRRIVIQGG